MAGDIPSQADVVIVGGGIAGCSVAYHLAKIGITDGVLLERHQLASGGIWHAAGLVTQLRAIRRMTELAKHTNDLFATLEAETGQATGFARRGSLRVANTAARYKELARGRRRCGAPLVCRFRRSAPARSRSVGRRSTPMALSVGFGSRTMAR